MSESRRKSARSKRSVDYAKYSRYLSDSDEDDEFMPAKEKISSPQSVKHKKKLAAVNERKTEAPCMKKGIVESCSGQKKARVITISDDEDTEKSSTDHEVSTTEAIDPSQTSDTSSHWYSPLPKASQSSSDDGAESLTPKPPPLAVSNEENLKVYSCTTPTKKSNESVGVEDKLVSLKSSTVAPVNPSSSSKFPSKQRRKSGETNASPAISADIQIPKQKIAPVIKPSIPKWTPPGPAGTQRVEDNRPQLGLRIGLSRSRVGWKPLHSSLKINSRAE